MTEGAYARLMDGATVVATLCAVILTASIVLDSQPGPEIVVADGGRPTPIDDWEELTEGGHRLGRKDAPVTIIEWGDYQCSACRSFQPHLEAVLRQHPETVSLVYRHWPLLRHQFAMPAARAAECAAKQDRFWEFHQQLYHATNWLGAAFRNLATEADINDLEAFEECSLRTEPLTSIHQDVAAVREIGGTGTPTIVVNGLLLNSVPDSLTLSALVAELGG